MLKEFYKKVLPSQGTYCVTKISPTGRVENRFADSVDELVGHLTDVYTNLFVAPNSFNNHSRRSDNALASKSFFVDLDVGTGDKKYPTKQEALEALLEFVDRVGLPPPVVVDSGGGVHGYWVLDRDVPAAEWKVYAQKLKDFCLREGLKIDPAVTADAARIMRAPGTLNHKTSPPRPTSVVNEIVEYDYDVFKEFLGPEDTSLASILAAIPKGIDREIFDPNKFNDFEYFFAVIAEKSLTGQGCGHITKILTQPNDIPEPHWRAGLSVAMRCVDADPSIYLMSEDYKDYDRAQTLAKAQQTLNAKWAYSCQKFDELDPGICDGCAFKGKLPSPTHLGKRLKAIPENTPEPQPATEPATSALPMTPEGVLDYLELFRTGALFPFMRGPNGGIYFQPPPQIDKKGVKHELDPVLITRHDFFPIKRMFSPHDGECLMMRLVLPHDPRREFLLPMRNVGAADKLRETLMTNGVVFQPEAAPFIMKYMIKWGEFLIGSDSAEQMRMQMGWTEDFKGFVIGSTEVSYDGQRLKTAASPMVKTVAKLLHEHGSYEEWQRAANLLNTPSMELHAFGLLTGFGSPLMRMTSTPGAAICLTGGSGCGKTGALYAALSVYGRPRELSVLQGNSTDNGFIGRYLNLKNLPFGLDEVTNAKPEELSKLIHQISQGKSKIRMQASVNAERELEQNASLILFMTSNTDITDMLQSIKASPDGEMARYIQFMLNKPSFLVKHPEFGKEIFDTFNHHYGHAGPRFVEAFYAKGTAYVDNLIKYWDHRFFESFGGDISYRFHRNLIAAVFAGGQLAIEAGIVKLDLERIFRAVMHELIQMHAKVKLNTIDFKNLLNEFCTKNYNGFLVMDGGRVVSEPRGALIGRSEVKEGMRYISKTALRNYFTEMRISSREFEEALKREEVLSFSGKRRLGTGWTAGADIGPLAVYGFKAEIEDLLAKPDGAG